MKAFHLAQLGGHVKVHHIAAVVAIQVEHSGTAVNRLGDLDHRLGGRRGEDVADGHPVAEAGPDVTQEDRQMAGATAGGNRDLAVNGRVSAHQPAIRAPGALQMRGMGQ